MFPYYQAERTGRSGVDIRIVGVSLDKLTARTYVLSHKHGENAVGSSGVADLHLLEQAVFRRHGRILELLVAHLAETFVALHFGLLSMLGDEGLKLGIGPAILLDLTLGTFIQRRSGQIEVAFLDDGSHAAEKERHQQRGDVGSVDVGIGHNYHLMVGQFREIHLLGIVFGTDGYAQGAENIGNLLGVEHLVVHCLLHVEHFASERKDGLGAAVAAALCRTACRVTLDEENLAFLRIAAGAVGELAGKSATAEWRFALYLNAGIVGGMARLGREDDLFNDGLGFLGMLLEIGAQSVAYSRLHGADHLVVAELGLRLTLELGFHHFHGNYSRQALAEVVAGNLDLALFEKLVVVGIFLECRREAAAETGEVCAALDGVDVVDERIDILVERRVVSQGHLYGDSLALGIEMDNVVDQAFLVGVDIFHELTEAVLGKEDFPDGVPFLVERTLVGKRQRDARVEECEVAEAVCKRLVVVDVSE